MLRAEVWPSRIMSQMSGHQTSKTATVITAILGSFLILVDGLVILLEHAHLLHYLEAKFPVFYAILTSQTSTVVLPIVGILVLLWLILEQRQSRVHLSSAKQTPPPILKFLSLGLHLEQISSFWEPERST